MKPPPQSIHKYFHHPQKFPMHLCSPSLLRPPSSAKTIDYIAFSRILCTCCFYLPLSHLAWFRLIYVVVCTKNLCHFITEKYSITWMYHNLLIYSPVDRHLDFQILVITDKAAVCLYTSLSNDIWFYLSLSKKLALEFLVIWSLRA